MERFRARLDQFEQEMAEAGVDAAAIAPGPNMYYLSEFAGETDRHVLLLVTADGDRTFVAPEHYAGQVRDATWIDEIAPVPANDPAQVAEGFLQEWDTDGRLLIDDRMMAEQSHHLSQAESVTVAGLTSEILTPMRLQKDETEQDALRRAADVADEISEEIRAYGSEAIGMTEEELAVDIRAKLYERGCEGLSFPVSVGAGPNGARPTQYRTGDREIRPGEPVVIDFGGVVDHYASDQTRTVVFEGEPTDEFVEVHGIVKDALDAALDTVEPGVTAEQVDAAARDVIEDASYGEQFTTGTGHGVGLRAHEPPSIAPGDETVLEPGMVFSAEPGIYLKGEFGVRLETLVIVTEDGAEAINTSPYTWEPL